MSPALPRNAKPKQNKVTLPHLKGDISGMAQVIIEHFDCMILLRLWYAVLFLHNIGICRLKETISNDSIK